MRRLLLVLLAGLLVLGGLVALGVGIAQRTVWLPDDEVTATARISAAGPVAVTAPGVLEMRTGPVRVTAESPDGGPVLLAVGREGDVQAWVDGAAHATVTGLAAEHRLAVEPADGEAKVPDPAASDLWVQTETGTGKAELTYDPPAGRWLLLAAGDGTTPAPAEVTMTWPREVTTPWSVPLIVAGAVLVVAGAALLVLLWQRGMLTGARAAAVPDRRPVEPAEEEVP